MQLLPIWNRIVEEIPDATLTITSDWSLWTGGRDVHTMPYRLKWASAKGVNYVGAVKREELIRIQSESEYHLYPCTYEELFCISVAESQVAGCVPVTSMMGAVDTTNRFGVKVQGSPESQEFINDFVDKVLLLSRSGIQNSSLVQNPARNEFSPERALTEWDKVLNG
jgi:glycosyltransferase involved in cell wall biosynthesis